MKFKNGRDIIFLFYRVGRSQGVIFRFGTVRPKKESKNEEKYCAENLAFLLVYDLYYVLQEKRDESGRESI